jgi:hypothetical protein
MPDRIELSEVLLEITDELVRATEAAKKRGAASMEFQECEVEFGIATEKKAAGGIKVWVLNLGVDAKRTQTNKIKLKFKALPGFQASQETGSDGPPLKRQSREPQPRSK